MLWESCSEVSVLLRCDLSAGKINGDRDQAIYLFHTLRPPEARVTLNTRNIPFVNHVKYLCVKFDKRIIWRLHIEMTETKAFRTFIRHYSLLRIVCLRTNIKLTLYAGRIRSVMTYACPVCELASDTQLLKVQRLKNKVVRITGNFPRCTPVRDLYTVFKFPYVHDYETKCCRKQAEVIQNQENEHVRSIGQGEARHRKYKGLKLGCGRAYDRSSN
jgi:hypothetical protein